jgi:hypothetical protein
MIIDEKGNCVTPPIDVCPNIEGNQSEVPEGMIIDDEGNCVTPPPPPTDVCPNIEGNQDKVPDGMIIDEKGNCVKKPKPVKKPVVYVCPGPKPCGARVEEIAKEPNDIVTVQYARGGYSKACPGGCPEIKEEWVYFRFTEDYFINAFVYVPNMAPINLFENWTILAADKSLGIFPEKWIGDDGLTYYILDVPKKILPEECSEQNCPTKPIVGIGKTWKIFAGRDLDNPTLFEEVYGLGSTRESSYISCSRTVGPWDVTSDGIATRKFGGPVMEDWVYFAESRGCSSEEAYQFGRDLWNSPDGKLPLPACAKFK